MTDNSHTPGPWVVQPYEQDHGASLAIVATATGWVVAVIPYDPAIQQADTVTSEAVRRYPDDIPNANVLAAAPNLLKTLEAWAFADADPKAARRKGYYDRAREQRDQVLRQLGSKAVRP